MYVTFSGDNMGLDQSREKLYCVRDNVQDLKGKAAFSISFLKHLEKQPSRRVHERI